jgi:argininosuccinate synthase
MKQRIVLAYDGSPESSSAIAGLARQHNADIVTLTLDLGVGGALDGVRDLSIGRGAIRAHVLEVQEEFARDIILPAAQAGTLVPGAALAAVVRPLLARKLVDVARIENAAMVAYVSRHEDDARLERLIAVLEPALAVVAVDGTGTGPDPGVKAMARRSSLTASVAHVEILFKDNVPVTINGIGMRLPELLESLATIAAEHGIAGGEHAFVPAATVLHAAYLAVMPSRDGVVRLKLSGGGCQVEERATA